MKRGLALVCVSALCVAGVVAQAPAQDRVLVDVGMCVWDNPEYPGFGPADSPDGNGDYWNNFSGNPHWGFGPIDLVDVGNNATGMQLGMKDWSGCDGDGGQVNTSIAPVNNLYQQFAQTDCRWWDRYGNTEPPDEGMGEQPGHIYLTGMDTLRGYNIGLYGYVPTGAMLVDDGPYPAGTTIYSIGAQSIEIDVMDNTTDLAWFMAVSPDAGGAITVDLNGGATPADCGAVVNVIEIIVLPRYGDATDDDCIDGADYTAWADYYEPGVVKLKYSEGGWTIGEWSDDAIVDGADYTAWADHYLQGCPQTPEPSSLALLAVAAALGAARRRKR